MEQGASWAESCLAEFVQYTQEFGDSRAYQWHVPFVIFATLFGAISEIR
jgi:hypothetical protein